MKRHAERTNAGRSLVSNTARPPVIRTAQRLRNSLAHSMNAKPYEKQILLDPKKTTLSTRGTRMTARNTSMTVRGWLNRPGLPLSSYKGRWTGKSKW